MACFSCAQKAALRYVSAPEPIVPIVCGHNEAKIDTLISKMECVMQIERTPQINSYMGILLSMKNIKDYCRYDITQIENFLLNYAC